MPSFWKSRRFRLIAAVALAAPAALWLLRWPLLGGWVRGRLDRLAAEHLDASIERAEIGGSLLFSVNLRNAVLRPLAGASFRRASIERLTVRYGLLGTSDPAIKARGIDVELVASDGTPSFREGIRTLPPALRAVAFQGRVAIAESRLMLPDGRVVAVDAARLQGSSWSIKGRVEGAGSVSVDASTAEGELRVDARASEGPVREVRLDWAPSSVRLETRILDHPVVWEGTVDLDREGRMTRVQGELRTDEGRAVTDVDLESGWVHVEIDAEVEARGRFAGRVQATGRVEGILGEPPERWRIGETVVRAESPRYDDVRLDEALFHSPGGSLDALPWECRLRLEGDRVEARGSLRWNHGIEVDLRAEPYAPPSPLGKLTELHVRARLDGKGLRLDQIEGRLGSGPFQALGRWAIWDPGRPLTLEIGGKELLAVDDDLIRVRVSPAVQVTYREGEGWRLSGDVEIPLFFYHREFPGGSRPSDRRSEGIVAPGLWLPPGEDGGFILPGIPGGEDLALDLRVRSTGEVRLENSVVGVLLTADLRLRGTAARPSLSGSVVARRGEVKLAAGLFIRIEWAAATLPEEPGGEATVRFEGSVGKGEGAISIVAEGPLEAPSLRLSSDPPRKPQEILAFLAFGKWPGALSESQAAGTLAAKLLDQATDSWPSADRKEGLLERFNPTVVTEEPARRRPPWELPSGTTRGTVVRAEYVLSPYFSVVAESDLAARVSGELKLRVRF